MKRPSVTFDKDAILAFLLAHGEKIGVAAVAVIACGLAWGGVNAARTQAATRAQQPKAIEDSANLAAAHILEAKQPPAEELRRSNLAKSIDPWRRPDVQRPHSAALFNKQLSEEKAKRSRPEVFPIEELRAVAGVAFMPEPKGGAAGRNPADVDAPEEPDGQPAGPRRRRNKPLGQAGKPDAAPEANEFGPGVMPGQVTRGRLAPYCVVTGLIPFSKQTADYRQRYEQAAFRDPQRDTPLWSDYRVERMVVTPGGREDWKAIDIKQFYADAARQWAGVQGEQLPDGFILAGDRVSGRDIVYCSPLPLLAGESWGLDSLHPWFVGRWKALDEERAAEAAKNAERATPILPGAGPGFDPSGGDSGPAMDQDGEGRPVVGDDYRMFRFVDTTVERGKTYRYRMRLSLLNPNRDLEARYLADAAFAKDDKLASAFSNVTDPVTVPGTQALLVRGLRKKFKAGLVEVLVLDKASDAGNYALRSLLTEPGGLINVDKRLNKPSDLRARGDDVFTEAVLVDMLGRQEDRAEVRGTKDSPPPEPLEMLFLRPDGSFTAAATADSQAQVGRFIGTLPILDDPKAGKDKQPSGPSPDGNPGKR
jgi:hypothetical protein